MGILLIEAKENELILTSSTGETKTLTDQEEAIKVIKAWIYAGW